MPLALIRVVVLVVAPVMRMFDLDLGVDLLLISILAQCLQMKTTRQGQRMILGLQHVVASTTSAGVLLVLVSFLRTQVKNSVHLISGITTSRTITV